MNFTEIIKNMEHIQIIPVITLSSGDQVEAFGEALIRGGVPAAEITFRSAVAVEGIALMAQKFPEILVGAGTVLTIEKADAAIKAGAQFLISPGFNPTVVDHCLAQSYPIIPGISSPS
jgi:2-dehydro-3-deoxyphosphogluconate aldolase / (4S)-4-hydroxy-2-oxoglutarate aldolase